jgi:S1-C subfamily serine protease
MLPGQVIDSEDFPRELQMRAATATVRVVNRRERVEGSGVILGRKGGHTYVLTTAHLSNRPGRIEVSTYSADSYPEPARVYDKVEVAARARDVRDLLLLRLEAGEAPPATLPLCPAREAPEKGGFPALSVGCGEAGAPVCLVEKVREARLIRRPGQAGTALFWETEAAQGPGRSGGPLLDRRGCLLGLASGTNEGRGYYCHAREIHRWLEAGGFDFLLPEKDAPPGK